jgi:hypothetical protein
VASEFGHSFSNTFYVGIFTEIQTPALPGMFHISVTNLAIFKKIILRPANPGLDQPSTSDQNMGQINK